MFALPARSDVDHSEFISPAMSRVPWVDKDCFFAWAKTSLMPASCLALFDLSVVVAWVRSPSVAVNIADTSSAFLFTISRFRFLKSVKCSAVCSSVRSRDCIDDNFGEHMHLRYVSLAAAQNWSMHVKYASRHVL